MTKRAVLYARVSGDDRAKTGGENVKAQLEMCQEYAQEKGYTIIREVSEDDRGASGAIIDLPELNRAIDLAQAGEYDVLIVREVDRLARSMAKCQIVEQELKGYGVKVEYALYDFPDTPEGRLNKNIYASFAEYEREKIAQRMTRGKLRKLRDGDVINHGRPPFGYRNVVDDDGKRALEIAPEEAETVKCIFAWYTVGDGENGPLSLRKIAKRLTKLHIPTYADRRDPQACTKKSAMGFGEWGRSSVASILSNEAYTGVWRYGHKRWEREKQIPLSIPVIIDRETWETAQERKARNKKLRRKRKYDYLMGGRLECGGCGRVMVGNPKRNGQGYLWLAYRCQARRRGYSCSAKHAEVSAGWVDDRAWLWVKELMGDEEGLKKSLREYREKREEITRPLRDKLRIADDLIAEGEKKIALLLDLYLDGEYSKEVLTERKARIESELVGLRREQARYTALIQEQEFSEERINTLLEFAQEVREGIEEAEEDFDAQRRFIELLDVTGVLVEENGIRAVDLSCVIGDKRWLLSNSLTGVDIPGKGSCCT